MLMPEHRNEKPLFGPDDWVSGTCTCGQYVVGRGRETVMRDVGFGNRVPCLECPACRARTPKFGGRAVWVAKLPTYVLYFQI